MPRTKNFSPEEALEKAVNLFWEQGYHATSMQNLVDALGINRASMYGTYGGKDELFAQALEAYQAAETKEVSAILYYYTDIRQGLYVMFEYFVDSALKEESSNSCFHVNTAVELANESKAIKESLEACRELHLKMYRTYLEFGKSKAQLANHKEIEGLAQILYNFQCGLMSASKLNPRKEQLMKSVSTLLTILD
ncbi:MAG: helix-turn-helix domain-containing protein [Vicingaceae bacterium]